MSELKKGTRVRVVSFDEDDTTGGVYMEANNLIGREGVVLSKWSDHSDDYWHVLLDDAVELLVPDFFLTQELEVIEENA